MKNQLALFALVTGLVCSSVSHGQYYSTISVGANVVEFDPAPDMKFREFFGPLTDPISLDAQRLTGDGAASAIATVGSENVLRARVYATTTTEDPTEGGVLASQAIATVTDSLFYAHSFTVIATGTLRIYLKFDGTINQTADSQASAQYYVSASNAFANHNVFPYQEFFATSFGGGTSESEGSFRNFLRLGFQEIDVSTLLRAGVDGLNVGLTLDYSLVVGAGGGVEISTAEVDVSNSARLWVEYYDENGILDPTVTFSAASGIDYTAVPEINSAVLMLIPFLGVGMLRAFRRSWRPLTA